MVVEPRPSGRGISDLETYMRGLSWDSPAGYYLERDPDVLVLRRLDGSVAGAFSARGAAPEAVWRMIEEMVEEEPDSYPPRSPTRGPSLLVFFFGRFEMVCDGNPLQLGRSGKALTILKYLLANHNRPVSQDHLMGWLWPESNLKKARWSLNSAIHGLRKLLSGCSSSVSTNYVFLEDGYYRLSPDVGVTTDVDDFDKHHERGRRLEKGLRMTEAAIEYEKAIELYRDDYLVEDLYEDWTMVEREWLANAYVDILDRLAVHYLERGQLGESVRACYQGLEKDRSHEDSHRLLMTCYVRLGQRGRALRQYHLCERILAQEYGTAPSPETRALYGELLGEETG